MDTQKSEAEAVASIVEKAKVPLTFTARKGVVVFPDGRKVNLEDERLAPNPLRKRARVALYEVKSFIDYVNAHKIPGFTHLFGQASESDASVDAVLDYHGMEYLGQGGAPSGAEAALPRWADHTARLQFTMTPEWKRWLANNNKPMSQEAFAEFIEDNLTDIIRPDAGVLIDIAQSLQGTKSVQFKAGKNLKNGSVQLQYTETIEATGGRRDDTLDVPDRFTLGIIPFVGAFGIELEARLRYRIGNDGKVSFQYLLDRPFKVIEKAFEAAREEIETKIGLPVHLGGYTIPSVPTY